MEPPEPTSAKLKLWRWLLLPSVITVALGGFVWWKSRSERLHFVEPIWSDSLAGHENGSGAIGQRRKIGEVWSLTQSGGFAWRNRGVSCHFEGRYPVFTSANRFQQAISERLLAELRDVAASCTEYEWSEWWDCVKEPASGNHREPRASCEVLFANEKAVSLRKAWSGDWGVMQNFVDRDGELHEVDLADLFHGSDWMDSIADICRTELCPQGELADIDDHTFLTFVSFALLPDGLIFHLGNHKAFIPYKKLKDHLRPDGPHRLFQTNVSE